MPGRNIRSSLLLCPNLYQGLAPIFGEKYRFLLQKEERRTVKECTESPRFTLLVNIALISILLPNNRKVGLL
jgi:hypothetical protein